LLFPPNHPVLQHRRKLETMMSELLKLAAKAATVTVVVIATQGTLELIGGALVSASKSIQKRIPGSN